MSNITHLAMLAVFSGLSVNLILQLGLGIKKITIPGDFAFSVKTDKRRFFAELAVFFITVTLLWLFFSLVRSVLFLGFLEYMLVFPVSLLTYCILEYLADKFLLKRDFNIEEAIFFGGTLSGAALFISLHIAGGFLEAVILSAGYAAGIAFALIIINEIRKRSEMEAVPKYLRGGPLVIITMGLLSLIFSAAAILLYQVLGQK